MIEEKTAKRIVIINGPNLNLLGRREPGVYGSATMDDCLADLRATFPDVVFELRQSNVEGELVNFIQEAGFSADGIILNAAAYTHTSIAIHDAIKAIETPVVEVHISNVYSREDYRHTSLITSACVGAVIGFGLKSYRLAAQALLER